MPDQFLTQTEMARSFLALTPVVVASTGTIARFHGERTELVDTTGGSVVRTLPDSLGSAPGTSITLVKLVAANTLTITPATGDLINGSASSIAITTQYASLTLWRTTTGWYALTPTTP